MAVISGRMIVYSPVSSNKITTPVIGARVALAKTAPMPINPYTPAAPATPGMAWCSNCPIGRAEHRADEQGVCS